MVILIVLLLMSSLVLSLTHFGVEDTLAFLSQQKQGVGIHEQGGAWNLHILSTIMLFFMIPLYVTAVRRVFGRSLGLDRSGSFYICLGVLLFISITMLLNASNLKKLLQIFQDPRHLAHSVRELMTFPMTYFPLLLYFFLKSDEKSGDPFKPKNKILIGCLIAVSAGLFLAGLFYQSSVSLAAGIGQLAQKPGFAKGGSLGIPYLFASHYFEHFLDSIYFTLFCLLLYKMKKLKTRRPSARTIPGRPS